MNIPDLFALTTQTKPSSILSKAIPQSQNAPIFQLGEGEEDTPVIPETNTDETSEPSETDTTVDPLTTDDGFFSSGNAAPQSGEEFSTFITLLTAQIRNQDPLAPLDSTQFVEQLATFSNLELQAKGNQTLEDISRLLAESVYGTRE